MSSFIKAEEVVKGGYFRTAPVDSSFNSLLLSPFTETAERRYVRDTLGTAFYEQLKTLRTPNTINYNSALGPVQIAFPNDPPLEELFINQQLFTLISYAVVEEALPNIHTKITSFGVQINLARDAQPGTVSDLKFLMDDYKEKIRFFQEEITDYLCENADIYVPFRFDPEDKCQHCKDKHGNYIYKNNEKSKPSTLPVWY